MFKQVIFILLTVSTLLAILFPFVPYIEYLLHYDHIVMHHCENRDNPEMDCDGACYLKKQIQKSSDGTSQPLSTNQASERLQILPIVGIQHSNDIQPSSPDAIRKLISYAGFYYTNPFLNILFRPPQV